MQKKYTYKFKYLALFIVFGIYFPNAAFALSPYVPVVDEVVEQKATSIDVNFSKFSDAFDLYVRNFGGKLYDDEENSIRTLLSLNPNPGVSAELILKGSDTYAGGGKTLEDGDEKVKNLCDTRNITNPTSAKPSINGAWEQMIYSGNIDEASLPNFANVRVNNSTSLSCLLQELVENDKLKINLQIHSLLRDYINTALSASLSQRTAGMISKANLDWVKKGNTIITYDSDGVPISEESYSTAGSNPEDYKNALLKARTKTIQQRLLADEGASNSLGVCNSFKFSTARNLLINAQNQNSDQLDTMSDEVGCQLTNIENPDLGLFASESDAEAYYSDPSVVRGNPFTTYAKVIGDNRNTKQGLEILMETKQIQQNAEISKNADKEYVAGGGYLPSRECAVDDPNCDVRNSTIVTPGRLIGDTTEESALQQYRYISNAKTPEEVAAAASDNFSTTNIVQGGLQNYNTNNLMPNQNIQRYVGEFLNGIRSGYYDLQSGTIDWASGAMLQIYDSTMTNSQAFTNANSTEDTPKDTSFE